MSIHFNNESVAYNHLLKHLDDNNYSKISILCDSNTKDHCLEIFLNNLRLAESAVEIITIDNGEKSKTVSTSCRIWNMLLENGSDRNSLLINLGGGVITDIGGFAASVYKRGISFINIPTTLLGMVDASIGGKTGVDFGTIKNSLGIIRQPELVLIDIQYLESLPNKELLNGFAEMLKHTLISDKVYWLSLIETGYGGLQYGDIIQSVNIKSAIVSKDEYEAGPRKLLNLGHTIGHGVEASLLMLGKNRQIMHGEAVAAGIIMESYIAKEKQLLCERDFNIIVNGILKYFPKIDMRRADFEDILKFMQHDKKNVGQSINAVLLKNIGEAVVDIPISWQQIIQSLEYYRNI